MKQVSVLLICLLACGALAVSPYSPCSSPDGTVQSVTISGCDNLATCPLHRGTNVTIGIDFTPRIEVSTLTVDVKGIIDGVPLPFNFPGNNACESSGLSCPLAAGQASHYQHILPVKSYYPALNVKVKFQLVDSANVDVVCVLIPCQIV